MADSLVIKLISLYGYIALGFFIGVLLKDRRNKVRTVVTQVLIKIISPLQIFFVLSTTEFEMDTIFIIQILGLALISYIFHVVSTYYGLRNRVKNNSMLGTYFLLNSFPNVMFFTIPIIISVFSDDLTIVSVIFASTMLILRGSIGTYFSEKLGSGNSMSLWNTLKKLFTFPPFLAILVGVITLALPINLPLPTFLTIKPVINELASGAGTLLIGMVLASINRQELKSFWKQIRLVSLWRFGFSFIFYMIFVFFLHFENYQTEIRTILLIIIMGPPAVFNVVFSEYFKLDAKFAAISVATVTLMSLVLLPLIILFGMAFF